MQAEEQRQRRLRSRAVTAPWRLKQNIRGLIYKKVVQQIWLKKKKGVLMCQYCSGNRSQLFCRAESDVHSADTVERGQIMHVHTIGKKQDRIYD